MHRTSDINTIGRALKRLRGEWPRAANGELSDQGDPDFSEVKPLHIVLSCEDRVSAKLAQAFPNPVDLALALLKPITKLQGAAFIEAFDAWTAKWLPTLQAAGDKKALRTADRVPSARPTMIETDAAFRARLIQEYQHRLTPPQFDRLIMCIGHQLDAFATEHKLQGRRTFYKTHPDLTGKTGDVLMVDDVHDDATMNAAQATKMFGMDLAAPGTDHTVRTPLSLQYASAENYVLADGVTIEDDDEYRSRLIATCIPNAYQMRALKDRQGGSLTAFALNMGWTGRRHSGHCDCDNCIPF